MKIINLTPHDITMSNGEIFSRTLIGDKVLQVRAKEVVEIAGQINGHNLYEKSFGIPYFCLTDSKGQNEEVFYGEFPWKDEEEELIFIVSFISLSAINNAGGLEQYSKDEFVSTGTLIRDEEGKIVGTEGFSTL